MMHTMKVAVIGLGVMGQSHTRLYAEMPNVELAAVYDINRELTERIAAQYGTVAADRVEAVFEMPDLDAVSICTADDQHYELAMLACKSGKHVLMEKPLASDIREAQEIVERVRQSGIKMMVGHTLRWDPRYYRAYEAVRGGKIGKPLHLYARRNNSFANGQRLKGRTSVLMFLGVHDIDAIEWITGDQIVEVYAVSVKERLASFGVSDATLTTLRFASGTVGNYETSWVLPEHHLELDAKLDITGTEGALNVDIVKQNISIHSNTRFTYPDTAYGVEMYGRMTGIMKEELTSFAMSVLHDEPLPISVEEAYRAVYIAHCMEESLRTGRPVEVRS
ncbi:MULTISPECIES: Gfo/Idh/MocA family protein [unclassified Paenibacillus]|uniref:Gfo/Idh/MocA family protein n=1 Tax=unclassified Paenibacillus TaxID=185978 RepID=UPI001C0F839A|nr:MULTISPECIES: Gfo/Idh/MocA family oxidoreductase [unclassified Paenibacillus]MBU5443940.1 Gfo/Idh/MocA family oxidoreductase [Paenibacillus sp. MSJ-34]